MKNNKFNKKWIVLAAALVILILLLTMCTARCSGEKGEEVPAGTTEVRLMEETTVPEETTAVPTESTEETTEATEATTEATTETTASTSSGTSSGTSGSGSSDSGDDDDDDDDNDDSTAATEAPVVIPDPGTAENPYVEVLSEYPGTVTSVNIPAGKGISYVIAGSAGSIVTIDDPNAELIVDGQTYKADAETGIVTLDLSKALTDPVVQISNASADAVAYLLNVTEGIGGQGNPEILEDITEVPVALSAGDSNGYYYQWTSTITGTLELTAIVEKPEEAEPETPNTEGTETPETDDSQTEELSAPQMEVIITVGEKTYTLSECEDGKLIIEVEKGQNVLIQTIAVPYEDGTYPAITGKLTGVLLPDLGTAENPQLLESIESIEAVLAEGDADGYHYRWTAATSGTVTLGTEEETLDVIVTVGETVYQLSEAEEGLLSLHVSKGEAVLIQTIAKADAEGVYPAVSAKVTGLLAADPGTPLNPAVLQSIETIAMVLEEGSSDGYSCNWTADRDGTLSLQVQSAEPEDAAIEVRVTNAAGETSLLSEAEAGILCVVMESGDTVTVHAVTAADENGLYPAAKITLKGAFEEAPGSSAENPLVIADPLTATAISLDAKETVYLSGMFYEMSAAVEGASGVSVEYDGETIWATPAGVASVAFPEASEENAEEPIVFSITTIAARDLTLTFAYPEGHAQNPARLAMGENKITLEENDEDGYLLTWTAECGGLLTIAMDEKAQWQYTIENLTAGGEPIFRTSAEETPAPSQTLEVAEGDEIRITVNTFDPLDETRTPAGKLTVTASFVDPLLGTEAKPIQLEIGSANTVTIPAGQSLYYTAEADGMDAEFVCKDVTVIHNGTKHTPEADSICLTCQGDDPVFVLQNNTETDQTCKITFGYPVGHQKNPDTLVLGENTAVLEEGTKSGYSFAWTAEGTGELTITMGADANWQYIIRNETTGDNGIVHTSEDDPAILSETVKVTLGDRILVIVNTFDLVHPLQMPAGEVRFTAEFVDPTLGMEENPIWLSRKDEITIPAGRTMYCTIKADGMVMTLKGDDVTVTHNGVAYKPVNGIVTVPCHGESTFEHPVFAVTNNAETEAVYTISFEYPLGHYLNPMEVKLGSNTASLEQDSECGCYFLWKSDLDGTLTVTVETERGWQFAVHNLTSGVSGEIRSCQEEKPVRTETVEVSKGDEIRIIVNTCDGEGNHPAGQVCFTAEAAETPPESAAGETEE